MDEIRNGLVCVLLTLLRKLTKLSINNITDYKRLKDEPFSSLFIFSFKSKTKGYRLGYSVRF